MRRKIELYIGDRLADLSDQALVLFNYTMEDLLKPTAVKNSYSKQVTLPATPANDAIFGYYFRLDRRTDGGLVTDTGMAFDATKKTPFTIYKETGEVLERGYLRLDGITTKGGTTQGYKVSLFGGLGELFYLLTQNTNGDKLTLADLPYLTGEAGELDFNITAENVELAWNRISFQSGVFPADNRNKWDIINFAPAYNGTPTGNFAADKAIATAVRVGLPANVTEGGVTYQTETDGTVVVSLANKHDEWACKDLRSYLQRPVLSIGALFNAITTYAANNGKRLTITSGFAGLTERVWMTLPMLPSIKSMTQLGGSLASTTTTGSMVGPTATYLNYKIQVTDTVTTVMNVKATASLTIQVNAPQSAAQAGLSLYGRTPIASGWYNVSETLIFVQMLAMDDNDAVLGGSPVQLVIPFGASRDYSPQIAAQSAGFTPVYEDAGYAATPIKVVNAVANPSGSGVFRFDTAVPLTAEAAGATRFKVAVHCYTMKYVSIYGEPQQDTVEYEERGACPTMFYYFDSDHILATYTDGIAPVSTSTGTVSYTSSSEIRSGAAITKANLLTSEKTPADYLLGLAKILGGVFMTDRATGDVTLMTRNEFYSTGEDTIDLSERVDRSQEITITPLAFNAKWYEFALEQVGSAYAADYQKRFGMAFGVQRIDTGYDFDGNTNKLMDGVPFKSAPVLIDSGRYWNMIRLNSSYYTPSVFLDGGNTAKYINRNDGKSYDYPISQPASGLTVTYYNTTYHGYDQADAQKLDFRGENGDTVDGSGVLCFYGRRNYYNGMKLTDDTAVMIARVGKPCWNLDAPVVGIWVPSFSTIISQSIGQLYFGVPKELDIPGREADWLASAKTLYQRYWQAYIRDRFNRDTRVLKCRVHLDGLQVGQDLLRRFFWYEGSLWALNKISNYSLTTWDPVECEFVQVQDKDNYTNGQTL